MATDYECEYECELYYDRCMELEAAVSTLRAQLAEREREWRPIETAPQDGSLLLVGWWETWPKTVWRQEVKAAGNVDVGRSGECWHHGTASHWMPLPEPPATEADK